MTALSSSSSFKKTSFFNRDMLVFIKVKAHYKIKPRTPPPLPPGGGDKNRRPPPPTFVLHTRGSRGSLQPPSPPGQLQRTLRTSLPGRYVCKNPVGGSVNRFFTVRRAERRQPASQAKPAGATRRFNDRSWGLFCVERREIRLSGLRLNYDRCGPEFTKGAGRRGRGVGP